jgi:hypothetical protein
MPYTTCPSCRLSSFTAAAYSSRDDCPRCGTELPARRRTLPSGPQSLRVRDLPRREQQLEAS